MKLFEDSQTEFMEFTDVGDLSTQLSSWGHLVHMERQLRISPSALFVLMLTFERNFHDAHQLRAKILCLCFFLESVTKVSLVLGSISV
ncbi:unnamed protein product [Lactuca virosa]|uniref:Uncharacterized protein n=1 Tax=Lactuca virosa TaxID=75947 RepID=A0AAU9PFJ6_9ASTR|nr:unnamed protein product [Lactuca virosa]